MNQSKENMSRLSIGSNFPDISLETTKGNIIKIPQDIKTKYCIVLFIRGAWWPKCTLQLEGYRKYQNLFDLLGVTIIAASVDSIKEMKLVSEGKRFPNREKEIKFHICYGVNKGLAKKLGAYWYDHGTGKDKPYIQGADKDYMQPAEFIIDCELKKVILCAYSDGGLGRMDAGDVIGVISGIEKRRDEFPHVWSWWSILNNDNN